MTPARPRKVVYLISDFEGGTANHLSSVVRHLDRGDWDPLIVCTDPRASNATTDRPMVVLDATGPVHRFPVAQVRELARLWRFLRTRDVDVLHCYFYWPIVYGRMLKAAGAVGSLVENREDEGFNWTPREYRVLRSTRSLVDRVIAVSRSVRDVTIDREHLDRRTVGVIHNAIEDVSSPADARVRVLRDRWKLDATVPTVGFVGNYERPVKGIEYLIRAVPEVRRRIPDVRFFIVGRGPATYRELARGIGAEEAIHFTGPTEDVDSYYGIFDVSVLPSLSEGLSLTLLESMAHGLPVVATEVGGNPEVVEVDETGLLVPARDPTALASAIADLLVEPARRREMGRAGRRRLERHFLQPTAARRYEELYRALLGPGRAPTEGG